MGNFHDVFILFVFERVGDMEGRDVPSRTYTRVRTWMEKQKGSCLTTRPIPEGGITFMITIGQL